MTNKKPPKPPLVSEYNIAFPDVPFASGGSNNSTGLSMIHTHPGVEFGIALTRGSMHLNGREYAMMPGDAYFVDALMPHWHYGKPANRFMNIWVCVPFTAVLSLIPGTSDTRLLLPFVGLRKGLTPILSGALKTQQNIREINRLFEARPKDWDIFCWEMIVSVLLDIYRLCSDQLCQIKDLPSAANYLSLLPAISRLDEDFRSSISIRMLADLCNLSPSRFAHLFSEITGISPIQYRNRQRIFYAMEQMITTSQSLSRISSMCGFKHLSQFRDAFVRFSGKTPGTYRKESPAL